ncbi:unnamed protein product [Effrenium voratum]|uniref:Fe2OG dioxygenase domain-containing protein n=1 Tax=Effrenium voratum TaxID=2562239 RepID=A0AA36IE19_9DINO|nr:unnamed protein product [Effrenium voratum]CAJ1427622.1 unnamed protein product [Effrenium voratum]
MLARPAMQTPRLLARTSIRGSRLAKRSLVQLRAEKVAAGSKLGALKAFLSAAGGLLLRRSKSSRLQDLGSVSGKDFVLRARAEKSPIAVDEEGELDLNPGGEDLHVLLAGREDHDYFCSPVPLRLRFFGQVPEVRVGGQLAFPLVGADRRLPKAFWDTFAAQGAGHDVAELLRAVRAFLLDPAGYLGLADSEAPEARRLQTWCRDAARLNGARLDVVRKYRPQARFPELFDASTLRPEWFPAETWQCLNPGLEGPADLVAWSRILTEHAPKEVYSFPLFTEEFCDMLLEEVFHFYSTGLPARRPNSMNNYGIILSDIGLEPFIDQLQGLLQPMGRELFPGPGSLWDGHHCFIVRYREGEDLGLDMHTDDSDVTFNICLGLDFQGAGLQFCGQVGSPEHRQHALTYQHRKGHCVVHLGKKRHGADDITQGERLNLILWNHSSEYRKSRGYRMPPYAKESAAPDKVCLSYTHDRDFGTFKDYPEGKGHFRGRGWCPPTQAEYPGFKPEMFRASKPR